MMEKKSYFIETSRSERKSKWSMAELHSHPFYEIYVLVGGKRRILFEDTILELSEGAVTVMPPFVMHKTEGGAFVRFNVSIGQDSVSDYAREILEDCYQKRAVSLSGEEFEEVKRILLELLKYNSETGKHASEIRRVLAEYLIHRLSFAKDMESPKSAVTAERVPTALLHMIEYIGAHIGERITLATLAKACYVSEATVCAQFKKYIGVTFGEYMTHLRIVKAKEMLLTTKKTMDEIAAALGLGSANYFGMFFKSHLGISPLKFRKLGF